MEYLSNPALQNFAVGGMVRGPGTGTSDSIDAKLSDGEFIMPADVVRHYGTDKLNKMVEAVGGTRKPIENKDGVIHAAQPLDAPELPPSRGNMYTPIPAFVPRPDEPTQYSGRGHVADTSTPVNTRGMAAPVVQQPAPAYKAPDLPGGTLGPDVPPLNQLTATPQTPYRDMTPAASTVATSGMTKSVPAGAVDLGNGNYISGHMAPGADVGYMKSAMTPSTPEQLANRARDVGVVAERHAASEAWDKANDPNYRNNNPSYQDQINDLISRANYVDDSSIGGLIVSGAHRHAAQNTLKDVAALRGQDISAQSERERTAHAQANLMSERDINAQKMAEEEARNVATENRAGRAEERAGRAEGMSRRKQTFEEGKATTAKTLAADKLAQAKADRAGIAESYMTEQGITRDAAGNYLEPGSFYGTNPLSAKRKAELQRLQSGGTMRQPKEEK